MIKLEEKNLSNLRNGIKKKLKENSLCCFGLNNESDIWSIRKMIFSGLLEDAITLLILLHYTKKDSVIYKTGSESFIFAEGEKLSYMAKALRIYVPYTTNNEEELTFEVFSPLYKQLDKELPEFGIGRRKAKLGEFLSIKTGLSTCCLAPFTQLWKNRDRDTLIKLIIAYQLSRIFGKVKIEIKDGWWTEVNKSMEPLSILDKIKEID